MKNKSSGKSYLLIIIILTAALTIGSCAVFAAATNTRPEDTYTDSSYTVNSIYAEIFPWNMVAESASPALGYIKSDERFSAEMLDSFAQNTLINSCLYNVIPHSAINSESFAEKIMCSDRSFNLWMKDHPFTAENGDEYSAGFIGYSSEYDIVFSAYCVRVSAISAENKWIECSDYEITDLLAFKFEDSSADIYSFADSEIIVSEYETSDEYSSDIESGAVTGMLAHSGEYIKMILQTSGFESKVQEFLPIYLEHLSPEYITAYKNGELILFSVNEVPVKLYLLYDTGTDSYCGWIRE